MGKLKVGIDKLNLDRFAFEAKVLDAVMTTPFKSILSLSIANEFRVAGGFLSNMYAGKAPKDMDVFCSPRMVGRIAAMASRKSERLAQELGKRGFINPRTFGVEHKAFRYEGVKSIAGIFEMDWTDGESSITIQFIGVDDFENPTRRFDLNFRRMSISPKEYRDGVFSMDQEAMDDFERGEATVNVVNNAARNYLRIKRLAKTVGLKPNNESLTILKDCMLEYVDTATVEKEPRLSKFYRPFDGWYSQSMVRRSKSPLGQHTRVLIGKSGIDSMKIYRESMRRMNEPDVHPIGNLCGTAFEVDIEYHYGSEIAKGAERIREFLNSELKMPVCDMPAGLKSRYDGFMAIINGIESSDYSDLAHNRWNAPDNRMPAKLGRALRLAKEQMIALGKEPDANLMLDCWNFDKVQCSIDDILNFLKQKHICNRVGLTFTISREVEDIVSMSTDQPWDSCANIDDGYDLACTGILEMISHGYIGLLRHGDQIVGRVNIRAGMYPVNSALIDQAYASNSGFRNVLRSIAACVLSDHGINPDGRIGMPSKYTPYSDRFICMGKGGKHILLKKYPADGSIERFILNASNGEVLSEDELTRLEREYRDKEPLSKPEHETTVDGEIMF